MLPFGKIFKGYADAAYKEGFDAGKKEMLYKVARHLMAEKSGAYFICGESGESNSLGLPDHILVCPSYGVDVQCTTIYERKDHGDSDNAVRSGSDPVGSDYYPEDV